MLEWRLKAYRHWLTMKEPTLGQREVSARSTTRRSSTTRRRRRRTGPKSLDEVDPELLETYEKLGIPLHERASAGRRRGGCGVRQRLGGDHLQGEARRARHHLLLLLRGGAESPGAGARSTSASVVPYTDNFFAALNSAVFTDGSFVLHPQGRALPDGAVDLLPHQRRQHRPVRAHADHRRRRRLRELPGRLHGADARREPAARGGGRAGRARRRARSSTRRCRTGIPATRKARAASTTS